MYLTECAHSEMLDLRSPNSDLRSTACQPHHISVA